MASERPGIERAQPTPVRELTQRDLALLRCPICRSALHVAEAAAPAEVRCQGCGCGFPIVDGLPVLLSNRATRCI